MAISITPANVIAGTGAKTKTGIAGATIVQGKAVYKDAADQNKYKLCALTDADTSDVAGIALTASSDGQPIIIQYEGELTIGGTLLPGNLYVLDSAAGGIEESTAATFETDQFLGMVGWAISTTVIRLALGSSGVSC